MESFASLQTSEPQNHNLATGTNARMGGSPTVTGAVVRPVTLDCAALVVSH